MDILSKIQSALKAPKGQTNAFGKYKYRSCEDILESVKPYLKEHSAVLTLTDDIVLIGDRYYVKATATLLAGSENISVCGFAREAYDKKGMDDSQITGAASSYARKYALNGLFCIDDTKDADTQDNTQTSKPPAFITAEQSMNIQSFCNEVGGDQSKFLAGLNASSFDTIPASQFARAMYLLENKRAQQ